MTRISMAWGRKPRRPPTSSEILARAGTSANALLAEPGVTPALRLNSDRGHRYKPDRLAELPDNAARLAAIRAEVERDVDLFARAHRRFLDLYFSFIRHRVDAQASAIEAALAWSGGLFHAEDAGFSALLPLPNAFFLAENGAAEACDFAFWTGARLVAVTLAQSPAPAAEEGAMVRIGLPSAALDSDALFAPELFPHPLLWFWEDDPVPSSPFRPAGLREGIDGDQKFDSRM